MALPAHRETELIHFARFSDAVALFVPAQIREFDFRPVAEAVRAAESLLRNVFVQGEPLDGQISLNALAATSPGTDGCVAFDIADLDPGDVALMLLSGGTTALPKLIPRTHNDYVYNFKQSARSPPPASKGNQQQEATNATFSRRGNAMGDRLKRRN